MEPSATPLPAAPQSPAPRLGFAPTECGCPFDENRSYCELGARVVLHGEHILEARELADDFVRDENMVYINGFDRPEILVPWGLRF
ncbi:threonine ammonia-lyase [Plasmopara halstedii]|uniref:Threonine ammonia-lyase n=1 Tax=Plasmopara halstedii TaxID=4781 RepID=A0A0P1ADJ4_PLAHL|nr:threonine ammonia-lyase [Plasmopara halstedii]CEG38564.1 threonine ammonia-lyase [Plasmopara halstedii]|eukprot:XP_024574933.1 threonine ammonia-lyase [Plasmopara halstedii]